jgi:hypothetical protein
MKTAMQDDKETAIEWLIRMLYSPACVGFISRRRVIPHEIIKQALEKEKEQIIDAYCRLVIDDLGYILNDKYEYAENKRIAEQYYNQTYNQNK